MARWVIAILLLLSVIDFQGQVIISGKVIDKKKDGIRGVSLGLKDSYDGATTDSVGDFRFETADTGLLVLMISSVGFQAQQITIIARKEQIVLVIMLKEEVSELKAVVITAGTFEAGDRKKATVLKPLDIVTTASANGDITGALKTLPGAQQVGEKEGLFVRGGTAAETKTFIDGSLVNNFFYTSVPNIAQRGRFSPFIFKGTVFSTGGYSALYGQALSSALILESIDLPQQSSASLNLTVLSAGGGYQHLAKNKKSSFGASYNYTNLALAFKLMKQQQDYNKVPEYHIGDANFRIKTSPTGILKYYGYFSTNRLGFYTKSLDTLGYYDGFGIKNLNTYHNLSYRETIAGKLILYAGLSYTYNEDNIRSGLYNDFKQEVILKGLSFKNFKLNQKGNYLNAKMVIEKRLAGLSMIRLGGEYNYLDDATLYNSIQTQTDYPSKITEHLKSGFAETDIYLTNDLAAKLGMRLENSTLLNKTNLAPRVSLAYKLGTQSQASVAYGIFYQNPESKYLTSTGNPGFAQATHYIAQFQQLSRNLTFRVEIFYKKYKHLLKTEMINNQQVAINDHGYGDARGFEIFWRDRKTIKNLDYWISYSYLDTKRDYLNFPFAIQPDYSAKHTASLVLKKFVTKLKTGFNASYNYNNGRPYYFIVPDQDNSSFKFTDQGKTPDYHNISFSLNFLPDLGKQNAKKFAVYVLSVSNVLGFDQVYGYEYSYNGYRKQAIVPPSKIFVFIGAFISFGIDRSEDIIINNL